MTKSIWSGLKEATNRIVVTVRRNRSGSNMESRLVLESEEEFDNGMLRTLTNSAWKTREDTEDAWLADLRWNGLDGPLSIRSHTHITIGSASFCLRSSSLRTTAPYFGSVEEKAETESPCSPSTLGSSPTGSIPAVEPGKMSCIST
ncbi:hypothetical protein [Coconut foliar decay alphasatellite R]|nr:hypothetical protein [Coconut foliar decay alphasatellite R]AVX29444.1 hypothetical protein [Coconut foliar decay alphasatellite R]